MIVPCRFLETRKRFGWFCDLHGLRIGVEVGVDRGQFSAQLLGESKHLFLYCVDPWQPYREMPHDRGEAYAAAVQALEPFAGRYGVVPVPSLQAAGAVPHPIDFVYVDGAHDYLSVKADLSAWWRRLRTGAVIAGHDFDYHPVRVALLEFFRHHDLYVVPEVYQGTYGVHPSWYVVRSGDQP